MPCWYYEKKDLRNTPSFQIGVDPDVEARYRREGARFIINTGTKMGLRYDTMATGVVYFHRFYMFHTFKDFPRYVTACCCLFLAGKVEETPKKCKDIIKTARTLLNDSQFTQFGDDPKVNLQEEVMTLERILLQTIKFDLQVDHPYGYLLKYAKCLKGDKQKLQKMVQMAWTFVNDSLCTSLCLQWEPEIIAIALMYLAGKLSKFEVVDWSGRQPKHSRWWDMYVEDMSMELLEDICHQVLDLYSSNPSGIRGDSPMSTSPSQMPGRPPTTQPMPTPATVPQQIQPVPTSVGKSRTTPPPPQPTPSAIPVQVSKTLPQETPAPPPAKPIQVVEHKPPVVQTVSKPIHPVVQQTIPVVSEPVVTHVPTQPPLPTTPVPLAQPANYNYPPPPPTENYTQFSSPVPPPPTYQPPPNYPPPNYPPLETPSAAQPPPPFDSSAPPPAQYTQPPPQHYPQGYDSQNYTNFQASSQQYFQNQSTYRAPPPPGPQFPDNYNNPPPSQYAPSPAPSTTFPTTPGHPPGYPPQNPPFAPMPSTYAPPRSAPPPHAHHPQPHQPPQHPPPNPGGNIAPVRITGRNNRQSWAM